MAPDASLYRWKYLQFHQYTAFAKKSYVLLEECCCQGSEDGQTIEGIL